MEWNQLEIEEGSESAKTSFKGRMESVESEQDFLSNERIPPFLPSFFVELIRSIRNSLGSIKNSAQIFRGKFGDKEFGDYYYRVVTGDIENMEMVLKSLIGYIKVHTPVRKKNTVHNIIEEVLRKHQVKLEEKGIKVFKRFEKDLPETIVPDEQLRYILSSVLEYAMALMPPNGNIGLSTKSFIPENETTGVENLFNKDLKYIRISMAFTRHQRVSEPALGPATLQKEETPYLILRFVRDVVICNHGTMKIGADEKKTKTFISFKLPVERRKVVYYQSVN